MGAETKDPDSCDAAAQVWLPSPSLPFQLVFLIEQIQFEGSVRDFINEISHSSARLTFQSSMRSVCSPVPKGLNISREVSRMSGRGFLAGARLGNVPQVAEATTAAATADLPPEKRPPERGPKFHARRATAHGGLG